MRYILAIDWAELTTEAGMPQAPGMGEREKIDYHDYSDDVIREMQRLGYPKPHDCHEDKWTNRDKITERNSAVLEMMLMGWKQKKIAAALGVEPTTIYKLTSTEFFKNALDVARTQRTELITKKVINKLYMPATNVVAEILENKDEKSSVRLDAAKYVIDQSVGKAEQKIHTTGNLLSEVIHRIEQMSGRDLPQDIETSGQAPDEMESFVNGLIGDGNFKVGQRGQDEGQSEDHRGAGLHEGTNDSWSSRDKDQA